MHALPAAFAAGGAWVAVKIELKYLRRDINSMNHRLLVAQTKVTQLATACRIQHGTNIDVNGFDDVSRD